MTAVSKLVLTISPRSEPQPISPSLPSTWDGIRQLSPFAFPDVSPLQLLSTCPPWPLVPCIHLLGAVPQYKDLLPATRSPTSVSALDSPTVSFSIHPPPYLRGSPFVILIPERLGRRNVISVALTLWSLPLPTPSLEIRRSITYATCQLPKLLHLFIFRLETVCLLPSSL